MVSLLFQTTVIMDTFKSYPLKYFYKFLILERPKKLSSFSSLILYFLGTRSLVFCSLRFDGTYLPPLKEHLKRMLNAEHTRRFLVFCCIICGLLIVCITLLSTPLRGIRLSLYRPLQCCVNT
jgi:hypothetical protein